MLMQEIHLARRKRMGEKNQRSVIPVQYVIITLAFVIALCINAIEEEQSDFQSQLWDYSSSKQRKPQATNVVRLNSSIIRHVNESTIHLNDDTSSKENDSTEPFSSSASPIETIGWVVTITSCGPDAIMDGAAVLKHSIHQTSIHGDQGGKYDYNMYAIYHPDGEDCALMLQELGYELIRRDIPVAVKDIEGEFLRKKIESNGCCGAKELVKLEAYTLTDHPIVVQLDLDVIVLKPMDPLFDMMLGDAPMSNRSKDVPVMWPDQRIPERINAFFTRDYHLSAPERPYKAVQGGFLVLRPDVEVYQEFVRIIRKGIHKPGGWGGLVGPFYGFMTFQGIIPYYYDVLHKNEAVELNRCIYNQMMDDPRSLTGDNPHKKCRTNQDECEDCRAREVAEVVSAHFTFCPKPWTCFPNDADTIELRLCRKMHENWFRIRSDLMQSWGRDGIGSGIYQKDHFFGFCSNYGQDGYIRIEPPYGLPIESASESDDANDGESKDRNSSDEMEGEDDENSDES